ncbi:hypothetical protein BDN72DRAFT_838607 [Pluteus cervinus]|uniref:Uncharacterized protein n=1 Tax=Pluteus cervinus TaxID=181527 RepID=A0ACD3AYR4_9AGAR|nr:hypothetical protein BDN72DRAFT_838607 [Pluteus cervinus]
MMSILKKITGGHRQNTSDHRQTTGTTRATSLDTCPEDVLLDIASYLSRRDLLNLRLVCPHLNSTFAPLTLRDVHITFRADHSQQLDSSPLPNLYRYAHSIHVRVEPNVHIPRRLLSPVRKTLGRLHSLRAAQLTWGFSRNVDGYIEKMAVAILRATNGKLEKLTLRLGPYLKTFPKALHGIRGLISLTIEHDPEPWPWVCGPSFYLSGCKCAPFRMGTSIAPLLIANPQIEELTVVHGCRKNRISPNDILSPAFPRFKTLVVNGLGFPSSRSGIHVVDNPALLRNLRHLQVLTPYSQSNLDPLWILLKAAHTHLESLITRQVSPTLADYLASFRGLHSLQLRDIESGEENSSTDVANTFLTGVLPRHASTLERLAVGLAYGVHFLPGWSFEADRWASCLPSLTNLRSLAIHPSLANGNGGAMIDTTTMISPYQIVIDHVQYLPRLAEVTFLQTVTWVSPSYLERLDLNPTLGLWMQMYCEAVPKLRGTTGRPYHLYSEHVASTVTRKDAVGPVPVFGWTIPTLRPAPYVCWSRDLS